MPATNLIKNFNLGDRCWVFTEQSAAGIFLADYSLTTQTKLLATIVGTPKTHHEYLLGWKDGDLLKDENYKIANFYQFDDCTHNLISNILEYTKIKNVSPVRYCLPYSAGINAKASKVITYPDGCICSRCKSSNPYAVPNQKNGLGYICYNCRT